MAPGRSPEQKKEKRRLFLYGGKKEEVKPEEKVKENYEPEAAGCFVSLVAQGKSS